MRCSSLTPKLLLWHNPPPLFHSLLVENVLWTESPSFVLRTSETFVFLPTSGKKVFPPVCVVVAVASILPLFLCHPVFYFAIVLSWGRAVPLNFNAKIKAWVEEGNICKQAPAS